MNFQADDRFPIAISIWQSVLRSGCLLIVLAHRCAPCGKVGVA